MRLKDFLNYRNACPICKSTMPLEILGANNFWFNNNILTIDIYKAHYQQSILDQIPNQISINLETEEIDPYFSHILKKNGFLEIGFSFAKKCCKVRQSIVACITRENKLDLSGIEIMYEFDNIEVYSDIYDNEKLSSFDIMNVCHEIPFIDFFDHNFDYVSFEQRIKKLVAIS